MLYYIVIILLYVFLYYMTLQKPHISEIPDPNNRKLPKEL